MNGHHAAEIAKTRAKTPGWKPYRYEVVGEGLGLMIRGALPLDAGLWGPHEDILVTALEIRAFEARYETETGKCAVCDGSGQVWAGYKEGEGHRYRPCSRKGCEGGTLTVTA